MRPRAPELVVVLALVGCEDDRPRGPSMFRDRRPSASAPAPVPVPVPVPDPPDAAPRTDCLPPGNLTSLHADSLTVRWCQDTDFDTVEDRCTVVDRISGRFVGSDPVTPPAAPDPPSISGLVDLDLDGYSDDVPSGAIDVCAAGSCATLRPALGPDDVIDRLRVSDDRARAAIAVSDPIGADGHYEIWDLAASRRVARIPPPPLRGGTFLFDVVFAGDAVVALAEHHDTDLRRGTIHALDGKRRGKVAGGNERIIPHALTTLGADRLVVAVARDDDVTVGVVSQDLATGRVLREVDVADFGTQVRLVPAGGDVVAVVPLAPPVAVLVDLATGATTRVQPETCP